MYVTDPFLPYEEQNKRKEEVDPFSPEFEARDVSQMSQGSAIPPSTMPPDQYGPPQEWPQAEPVQPEQPPTLEEEPPPQAEIDPYDPRFEATYEPQPETPPESVTSAQYPEEVRRITSDLGKRLMAAFADLGGMVVGGGEWQQKAGLTALEYGAAFTGFENVANLAEQQKKGLLSNKLKEIAKKSADYWQEALSPKHKEEIAKPFFTKDEEGNWKPGPGLKSIEKILGITVESAPVMGLMALGSGALALQLRVAGLSPEIAGIVSGAISEGGITGKMDAEQTYDEIMQVPESKLKDSEIYEFIYEHLPDRLSEKAKRKYARKILAAAASTFVGATAGISTAIFGAPSGAVFGRLVSGNSKNIFFDIVKETLSESLVEEFPQGYLERVAQNIAAKYAYDPTREITAGALEEATGGALAATISTPFIGAAATTTEAVHEASLEAFNKTKAEDLNKLYKRVRTDYFSNKITDDHLDAIVEQIGEPQDKLEEKFVEAIGRLKGKQVEKETTPIDLVTPKGERVTIRDIGFTGIEIPYSGYPPPPSIELKSAIPIPPEVPPLQVAPLQEQPPAIEEPPQLTPPLPLAEAGTEIAPIEEGTKEVVPYDREREKWLARVQRGQEQAPGRPIPEQGIGGETIETGRVPQEGAYEEKGRKAEAKKEEKKILEPEDAFKIDDTDVPYYNKKLKEGKGKIIYMSPDEYISRVADLHGSSVKRQYDLVYKSDAKKYAERVKAGEKAPLPFIDYKDKTQEGRHRAYMAKLLGLKEIPVFVIGKFKPTPELLAKKAAEAEKELKQIVKEAKTEKTKGITPSISIRQTKEVKELARKINKEGLLPAYAAALIEETPDVAKEIKFDKSKKSLEISYKLPIRAASDLYNDLEKHEKLIKNRPIKAELENISEGFAGARYRLTTDDKSIILELPYDEKNLKWTGELNVKIGPPTELAKERVPPKAEEEIKKELTKLSMDEAKTRLEKASSRLEILNRLLECMTGR